MKSTILVALLVSLPFVLPSQAFAKKKRVTSSQPAAEPAAEPAAATNAVPAPAALPASPAVAPAPQPAQVAPVPRTAPLTLHIADAETQNKLQLVGMVDYGTNHLNAGFGARAGYTLPYNVYLGASIQYFLGETQTAFTMKVSASYLTFAGEVGYDFQIVPHLVVRPLLGIGAIWGSEEICGLTSTGCQSQSDSHSLVELGAVGNYLWGSILAGGEMRLVLVNDSAFVLGAHIGYMF
jgi:hypothetical protein